MGLGRVWVRCGSGCDVGESGLVQVWVRCGGVFYEHNSLRCGVSNRNNHLFSLIEEAQSG